MTTGALAPPVTLLIDPLGINGDWDHGSIGLGRAIKADGVTGAGGVDGEATGIPDHSLSEGAGRPTES